MLHQTPGWRGNWREVTEWQALWVKVFVRVEVAAGEFGFINFKAHKIPFKINSKIYCAEKFVCYSLRSVGPEQVGGQH